MYEPNHNPNALNRYNDVLVHHAVLMIRAEICLDICFPIVNVLTSPLIMYSKFVWSNLV